jgi:hypothetical protein
MTKRDERKATTYWVRGWLIFFIVALLVSGLTAFPLETELRWGSDLLRASPAAQLLPDLVAWFELIRDALIATNNDYPYLAYGTDWLAFAHIVIAIAFIGPLRDPVRNIWIIQWGMIACIAVLPLALIAGSVRGIPVGWMLVDMSFGVFGIIPLLIVYRLIRKLERLELHTEQLFEADGGMDLLLRFLTNHMAFLWKGARYRIADSELGTTNGGAAVVTIESSALRLKIVADRRQLTIDIQSPHGPAKTWYSGDLVFHLLRKQSRPTALLDEELASFIRDHLGEIENSMSSAFWEATYRDLLIERKARSKEMWA